MRPVLFRVWGRPVRSYPAMLYLGLVAGTLVGQAAAAARGLDGFRVWLATLLLIAPALAGARLAYVAGHREAFASDPGLIWRRSVGGQAMYGGLLAVPVSVPLLAALDLSFWAFWDVAAFTMLTGMVFTRVGCLLTGCCSGRPTDGPFGVVLPDHRGIARRRIPVQPLEAALGCAVLAAAASVDPVASPPGTAFLTALAGYAIGRVALEGAREGGRRVGGVAAQRVASMVLATAAVVLLVIAGR
jgi:prolipoprotein diacylglyceryltransferase